MTTKKKQQARRSVPGAILSLLLTLGCGRAEVVPDWSLEAQESPIQLDGFLGSLDLSGIAKAGSHIVVVSDELSGVQTGTLNEETGAIEYSSALTLATAGLSKKSGKKKEGKKDAAEIDIEGVCFAADEKAFYVTGSHGVGKKKGDFQPMRYGVYRIPFDPATGVMRSAEVTRSTLLTWLETSALFKEHVRQPLQQNGFNIEGLACAGGRLYFGVRAPGIDGTAFIIEAGAEELFRLAGAELQPKVHTVPVGPDRGIRELVSVGGGFLMLTGNAGAEASKQFPQSTARQPDTGFALSFLPSNGPGNIGRPESIGDVSAPDGKAEGLLVLRDADGVMDLLILHDGLEQGGATMFTVRRPAKQVASGEK